MFLTCGHSSRLLQRLCSACEYVYSAHTHTHWLSCTHAHTHTVRWACEHDNCRLDVPQDEGRARPGPLGPARILSLYSPAVRTGLPGMCNRVGIAYIYAHARTLSHTNTHNTHTHTHRRPFQRRLVPTRHCASFWIIRRGRSRTRDLEQFRASLKPCGHQASEGETPGTVFGNVTHSSKRATRACAMNVQQNKTEMPGQCVSAGSFAASHPPLRSPRSTTWPVLRPRGSRLVQSDCKAAFDPVAKRPAPGCFPCDVST